MPAKSQAQRVNKRGWHWSQQAKERLAASRRGDKNPGWKGGQTSEQKKTYAREWRKRNESYVRDCEYRKRFGISLADYEAMLLTQNGVCAICKEKCNRGRLCIDHCHKTGRVRGLLCRMCNVIIGLAEDDPNWLKQAEVYLARS